MSPVPEPTQGGRVGPGNGEEEEEEISPPMGLFVGPPVSSSDDEPEQTDVVEPYTTGYQPLSQDNDLDEDEAVLDYTSLSGLMSSLTTHGPNVGSDAEGSSEADRRHEDAASAETNPSVQTTSLVQESARQRHDEVLHERAAVWNSSPAPDRLILDGSKVEEIKNVMASFTLPQSAIPLWAQNLSEDDWKDQIADIITRTSH